MAQMIIEQPGLAPMTVPLSGEEIHFGRAEDNSVVLTADEVSRHHAKIHLRGSKHILFDLNSLNGTYVNRQRIVERVLSHMDEIWFGGKCRLVYRDDTHFGRADEGEEQEDSSLTRNLAKIRDEMDRVGNSLTMIGQTVSEPAVKDEQTPPPQFSREELKAMSRAYRRLQALNDVGKLMASEFDLPKRLSAGLDMMMDVMSAERGFIMLRDEGSDKLRVSVAREMGQELAASSPSMGIAGKSAIDGEPVLMANAQTDKDFGARESIVVQRIISAMCVPLKVEDRILGSIYVDTRRRDVTFDETDLELFASLATQSALAIDNVHLHERVVEAEKKRADLGRFLSPAIVEAVMKEGATLELGGSKQNVTTLFCDIRGFTPIAERLSPGQMVDLLNEHFTAMTELVFEHRGTLDKYIGDEIMAVFGTPLGPGETVDPQIYAEHAVRTALAIQAKNAELNRERKREGRPVLHLGTGVNTGEAIAGYLGSPMRMDFTVVGDSVNTARRLCDLAEKGKTIVGGHTHAFVKDMVVARSIGNVTLEGKAIRVDAYEIESLK